MLKGGRHKVVPGTPEEYRRLYTECWDENPDKRPTSEQCYHRLKNVMEKLNQLPERDTSQYEEKIKHKDHPLSGKLSMTYNKLQLKGKSMKQTADFIKNWLIQNSNNNE